MYLYSSINSLNANVQLTNHLRFEPGGLGGEHPGVIHVEDGT